MIVKQFWNTADMIVARPQSASVRQASRRALVAAVGALGLALAGGGAAVAADGGYRVAERIAGPDGGYDYISVDGPAQTVFVARSTGVMTLDLATLKITSDIVPGVGVAAVMIIPGTDMMLSTNWRGDTATLFNRKTGAVKASIPTGKGPDGAQLVGGFAYVMNHGSSDISVIDLASAKVVATIPAGGVPEAAVSDGKGRLYVNVEDAADVLVIDTVRNVAVGRYPLPGCVEPTGIAFDAASGLLLSACHNGVVKLIDHATGADRGSVPVGKDADGAIFDAARRLAYIPCGDGTLSIFSLDARGAATAVATVVTQPGAGTAALDPDTGRLYLPAADYVTGADGEETRVPGTFKVLVVEPVK